LTGTESRGDAGVKRVTEAEAEQVTELFTLAFADDPTWSWAFPDPDKRMEHQRAWWGLYVHSAVPYGWVWMTDDGGAASVWIPAGESELSDEDEARVDPLLRELVGTRADDVLTLLDRFNSNRPRQRPHYYLSLLGTHPDHRGRGKGMGLLVANLAQIDELKMPAYLESSNRANDHRYQRLGFVHVGEFTAPGGEPKRRLHVACSAVTRDQSGTAVVGHESVASREKRRSTETPARRNGGERRPPPRRSPPTPSREPRSRFAAAA
jgi:GNAT superfamily N-acetyltransferase